MPCATKSVAPSRNLWHMPQNLWHVPQTHKARAPKSVERATNMAVSYFSVDFGYTPPKKLATLVVGWEGIMF